MPRAKFSIYAADYPGTLAETEWWRLCVSCDGSRYVLLSRDMLSGPFVLRLWSRQCGPLLANIAELFGGDVADALPSWASAVPRPWMLPGVHAPASGVSRQVRRNGRLAGASKSKKCCGDATVSIEGASGLKRQAR